MKKYFSSFGLMAMSAMLVIGLMVPLASAQGAAPTSVTLPRTVTVYGDGKVSVKPDRAILNLQIEGTAKTSKDSQAKRKNDLTMIMDALQKAGIKGVKVRTTWYNTYPLYDSAGLSSIVTTEKTAGGGGMMMPTVVDGAPAKISGYNASHSVAVTVPFADMDKAYEVLEGMTQLGTLTMQYVNVSVDNPEMYLDKARQDAATIAKARADKWATIFGVKVGKVMTVTDYNSTAYSPDGMQYPYSYSSDPSQDMNVDLTVQIQATFEML